MKNQKFQFDEFFSSLLFALTRFFRQNKRGQTVEN